MATMINVFTLNCWGIPLISKDRTQRIRAIADNLALQKYDIVCLQEVWSESDYMLLQENLSSVLPYSHYFYSGVFGSGVCIFSKFRIEEVFFHQWPLNGYVHKLHHGDWFGGKGIGLCVVKYKDITINVYSAHLHAEYNRGHDEYMAHRVLQAFNMSEFIRLTSANADVVILGGDLNTEPGDLSYRIICHNAQLQDSFLSAKETNCGESIGTNESIRNSYTDRTSGRRRPQGKRIDYILYRSKPEFQVNCETYQFPLPSRVPEQNFSYSDHEAVQATVNVSRKIDGCQDFPTDLAAYKSTLNESIAVCNSALSKLMQDQQCYLLCAVALLLTLISTMSFDAPFSCVMLYNMTRIGMALWLGFATFMGTIWNRMERNAVLTGKLGMEVVRQNLP